MINHLKIFCIQIRKNHLSIYIHSSITKQNILVLMVWFKYCSKPVAIWFWNGFKLFQLIDFSTLERSRRRQWFQKKKFYFLYVNSGISEIASVTNHHRPVLQQLNVKGQTPTWGKRNVQLINKYFICLSRKRKKNHVQTQIKKKKTKRATKQGVSIHTVPLRLYSFERS